MSKKIELEELKKKNQILEEERLLQDAKDKLAAQNQQEESAKKTLSIEGQEEEQSYQITKQPSDLYKEIIADYEKEDYAKPLTKDGALVFPSPEESKKFFTEQAGKNREFLATLMEDGQLQDSHHFSCGDGQLYSGSYQDIQTQLASALKTANGSNREKIESGIERISSMQAQLKSKSTSTQEMKAKMQGLKEDIEAGAHDLPDHKSPTPLSTTNKPG